MNEKYELIINKFKIKTKFPVFSSIKRHNPIRQNPHIQNFQKILPPQLPIIHLIPTPTHKSLTQIHTLNHTFRKLPIKIIKSPSFIFVIIYILIEFSVVYVDDVGFGGEDVVVSGVEVVVFVEEEVEVF